MPTGITVRCPELLTKLGHWYHSLAVGGAALALGRVAGDVTPAMTRTCTVYVPPRVELRRTGSHARRARHMRTARARKRIGEVYGHARAVI